MARKFKTAKQNREEYTYYFADGTHKTINLSDPSVTEADIALNHQLDDADVDEHRRSQYHLPTDPFSVYETEDFLLEIEDEKPTPVEAILLKLDEIKREEKLAYANELLETLTEIQRKTFELYYIEGLSLREISRQEKKDFSTVKECIHGIDKKIKKYFEKHPLN